MLASSRGCFKIDIPKGGGPAGPLAQTVVAPDAATDGVVSEADARIV